MNPVHAQTEPFVSAALTRSSGARTVRARCTPTSHTARVAVTPLPRRLRTVAPSAAAKLAASAVIGNGWKELPCLRLARLAPLSLRRGSVRVCALLTVRLRPAPLPRRASASSLRTRT